MKIIFLDVDGVLNNFALRESGVWPPFDQQKIMLIQKIILSTGAKIVISSDWRRRPENLNELTKALNEFSIDIFGCTPLTFGGFRNYEIKLWMENNKDLKIDDFVILDDMDFASIKGHFFKCDDDFGLTEEITDSIIERFNK